MMRERPAPLTELTELCPYGAIVQEDFYNREQSWFYTVVVAAIPRLRVRLRRNAYDAQSYGIVEAWHDGWQEVIRKDVSCLRIRHASYVQAPPGPGDRTEVGKPRVDRDLFVYDAADLIEAALMVEMAT